MGYFVGVEPDVKVFIEDLNPAGKKAVLFLHGWPLNHQAFEYQLNQIPKSGIRCIAMDMRGFGRSDKPWDSYSYDRLADDLYQVIGLLGLRDITLAGHSMGGAVAIRYMARHGGRGVGRLALLGAAAPSFVKRTDFNWGFQREEVTGWVKQCYDNRPQLLKDFGDMFFFKYVTSSIKDWFFQLGLAAAGWSTAACLISLRDEELFSDLREIDVPTLILHGVHDKICPYPLALAQKEAMKDAKLVPFETSGHGLFYEEWGKLNYELEYFLKK